MQFKIGVTLITILCYARVQGIILLRTITNAIVKNTR